MRRIIVAITCLAVLTLAACSEKTSKDVTTPADLSSTSLSQALKPFGLQPVFIDSSDNVYYVHCGKKPLDTCDNNLPSMATERHPVVVANVENRVIRLFGPVNSSDAHLIVTLEEPVNFSRLGNSEKRGLIGVISDAQTAFTSGTATLNLPGIGKVFIALRKV